jgi:hypothetical protein
MKKGSNVETTKEKLNLITQLDLLFGVGILLMFLGVISYKVQSLLSTLVTFLGVLLVFISLIKSVWIAVKEE